MTDAAMKHIVGFSVEAEIEKLKQQVADNDVCLEHANEIIGKYEQDVIALKAEVAEQDDDFEFVTGQNTKVKDENEALKAKVARLEAPVSECRAHLLEQLIEWSLGRENDGYRSIQLAGDHYTYRDVIKVFGWMAQELERFHCEQVGYEESIKTTRAIRDKMLAARSTQPAHGDAPAQRYRLNSGPCAAQVVDCDCRGCRPDLQDAPAQKEQPK